MGKVAFVFAGQGAQAPGMGQRLAEYSPAAVRVYDMAEIIHPGTKELCWRAAPAQLNQTIHTQPCLFCVDLGAAEALRARGVVPDLVAGFSLGEIPALAFAGMLSEEEAFRLVCVRAEAMQACAEATPGGMAAVLGLEIAAVEAACLAVGNVYPVNYNCPGQLVIAGEKECLAQAGQALKAQGGRILPLPVSGAFHTECMTKARERLAEHLHGVTLHKPVIPVFSNETGCLYAPPYAEGIARQVSGPVRWQAIIERMAEMGVTTFVEVGIGKTLCGCIRKTVPGAKTLHVEDPESLEDAVRVLNGE